MPVRIFALSILIALIGTAALGHDEIDLASLTVSQGRLVPDCKLSPSPTVALGGNRVLGGLWGGLPRNPWIRSTRKTTTRTVRPTACAAISSTSDFLRAAPLRAYLAAPPSLIFGAGVPDFRHQRSLPVTPPEPCSGLRPSRLSSSPILSRRPRFPLPPVRIYFAALRGGRPLQEATLLGASALISVSLQGMDERKPLIRLGS